MLHIIIEQHSKEGQWGVSVSVSAGLNRLECSNNSLPSGFHCWYHWFVSFYKSMFVFFTLHRFLANLMHKSILLSSRDFMCKSVRASWYPLYCLPRIMANADFWTRSRATTSSLVRSAVQTGTANSSMLHINF